MSVVAWGNLRHTFKEGRVTLLSFLIGTTLTGYTSRLPLFAQELPPIQMPEYIIEGIEEIVRISGDKAEPFWGFTPKFPDSTPTAPPSFSVWEITESKKTHWEVSQRRDWGIGSFSIGNLGGGGAMVALGMVRGPSLFWLNASGRKESRIKGSLGDLGGVEGEMSWVGIDKGRWVLALEPVYRNRYFRRLRETLGNKAVLDGHDIVLRATLNWWVGGESGEGGHSFLKTRLSRLIGVGEVGIYQPLDSAFSGWGWKGEVGIALRGTSLGRLWGLNTRLQGEDLPGGGSRGLMSIQARHYPGRKLGPGAVQWGGEVYFGRDGMSKAGVLPSFLYQFDASTMGTFRFYWAPQASFLSLSDLERLFPYAENGDRGGIIREEKVRLGLEGERSVARAWKVSINSIYTRALHQPFPLYGPGNDQEIWKLTTAKAAIWENKVMVRKEVEWGERYAIFGVWREGKCEGVSGNLTPFLSRWEGGLSTHINFYPYRLNFEVRGYGRSPRGFKKEDGEYEPYIGSLVGLLRDSGGRWYWSLTGQNLLNRVNPQPLPSPPFTLNLEVSYRYR